LEKRRGDFFTGRSTPPDFEIMSAPRRDIIDPRKYKGFSASAISFQVLVWAIIPIFVNSLLGFLLISMKKQRAIMISNIICLKANLAAGFILVPYYGHAGASLAFFISSFVFLMVNFYYISKYLEAVPLHCIALQPLVAGAVMFIFLFLMGNKFNMAMPGISTFLIYFGVLYISGTVTPDEIELFKSAIPARFQKPRKYKPTKCRLEKT